MEHEGIFSQLLEDKNFVGAVIDSAPTEMLLGKLMQRNDLNPIIIQWFKHEYEKYRKPMTAQEVADRLGKCLATARKIIKEDGIEKKLFNAIKSDGEYIIDRISFEKYLEDKMNQKTKGRKRQ